MSVCFILVLLLILLINLSNFFIFCINVDIDEMLLLQKKKGLGVNAFRVISLCYYCKIPLAWICIVHAW